jgi:UDP-glucuronate decarboxylase
MLSIKDSKYEKYENGKIKVKGISEIIKEDVEKLAKEFENSFSSKRILVTGGAGFLGSWLCDVIVRAGGIVDCLDNLSTGKMENVEHLRGKAKIIINDVEKAELNDIYDYIFHFSSRASPEEYQEHPIQTLTANSIGTLKMLELAKKCNSIFVYASSSEVYGDAKVIPTPETYYGNVNPIGVRSCYDEGKRFGEALCMAYYRESKVDVRIARIFNSYGPRIRHDGIYARALPKFTFQAIKNEPITIYGDGRQTRSFCYVYDTLRGILKLAISNVSGEVFNIGNPNEINILRLAEVIKEIIGSKSEIVFLPPKEDDPRRRCPDINKAIKVLGWKPGISLKEGLRRTIRWIKESVIK